MLTLSLEKQEEEIDKTPMKIHSRVNSAIPHLEKDSSTNRNIATKTISKVTLINLVQTLILQCKKPNLR
jgi:hypothetical protein